MVIDNGGAVGDAAVDIPGMDRRVGPTSTVIGAAILNALVAEAVEILASGARPWTSSQQQPRRGDAVNAPLSEGAGPHMSRPARRAIGGTASPFTIRGVIEGFYGRPWTHAQRLDMIQFIGRARHEHVRLRTQGRPAAAARLADALRRRGPRSGSGSSSTACRSNGVDFVFCLSPGLSIRYSSDR